MAAEQVDYEPRHYSTCGRCGGTIAKCTVGWGHTGDQPGAGCIDGHTAEPDDSWVADR